MSYSAYLEEHVQTQLTKAIAAATLQNPKDAVDFIGQYLLKIVDDDAKSKQIAEVHANWAKEDEALEIQRKEQALIVQQKEEAEKAKLSAEEQFYVELKQSGSKTKAMQSWSEFVATKTNSASVYIGAQCQVKQEDEDVNAVLYNAISSKADRYLLQSTLIQSETKGVVFELLKEEEPAEDAEEEEDEDEENAAKKKEEPPKPRRRIHIENVLLPNAHSDKLHFFKYPKVGSFLAFESTVRSYLNAEALTAPLRPQWPRPLEEVLAEEKAKEEAEKLAKAKEAEAAAEAAAADDAEKPKDDEEADDEADKADAEEDNDDEEEEKQEVAPDPPQTTLRMVVSMDTLGDAQQYSDATVQWVDDNVAKLEEILTAIDVAQFLKQRQFEEAFAAKLTEYNETGKEAIDAKMGVIDAENAANGEELKEFKKAAYAVEATQPIWSLIGDHVMKPEQPAFGRIVAAFAKLFEDGAERTLSLISSDLTQCEVISDAAWDQSLAVLSQISAELVNGYNVTALASFDEALFDRLLEGIVAEDIGAEGVAVMMTILFQFVDATNKLWKFSEAEKEKADNPEPAEEAEEDAE